MNLGFLPPAAKKDPNQSFRIYENHLYDYKQYKIEKLMRKMGLEPTRLQ